MASLKASKLNLCASSGACVSQACWVTAWGVKLNINIKSFFKRLSRADGFRWKRSLNSFNHCIFWLRTKAWRKLLQKVLFNWFAKECSPRNASRQGCVGVVHAAVDAIERNSNKKKDCLNKHLAFILSPWLSFGATQRPELRLLGGIFPILSLSFSIPCLN